MGKKSSNMEHEVYQSAPIIRAMMQFRYNKIEGFNPEKITSAGKSIKSAFPISNVNMTQTLKIDPKAETKISLAGNQIEGVRFDSKDKTKILVVGVDKFTLEISGEYPGWDSMAGEAKKYWELFSPHLDGIELIGLSTRFINKFDIPVDTKDIKKYFNVFIHSDEVDEAISKFQFKYTIAPDNDLTVNVGHVLDPSIHDKLSYFYDIDAICHVKLPNEEKEIWARFNALRDKKNKIFNSGITEETKKLIR